MGELLRLTVQDIPKHDVARGAWPAPPHHVIDVVRRGRKSGCVIASESLLEETAGYLCLHRRAGHKRAVRKR